MPSTDGNEPNDVKRFDIVQRQFPQGEPADVVRRKLATKFAESILVVRLHDEHNIRNLMSGPPPSQPPLTQQVADLAVHMADALLKRLG